jgi:hypothetical protein
MEKIGNNIVLKGKGKCRDIFPGLRCCKLYNKMAKPKKTLPKTAAMLRPALGMKEAGAAPPKGAAVAVCPPNPAVGILLVAEAPVGVELWIADDREALPL